MTVGGATVFNNTDVVLKSSSVVVADVYCLSFGKSELLTYIRVKTQGIPSIKNVTR